MTNEVDEELDVQSYQAERILILIPQPEPAYHVCIPTRTSVAITHTEDGRIMNSQDLKTREDAFEGINKNVLGVNRVVQTFEEAVRRTLNGLLFRDFISENLHPNTLFSFTAQLEPYLYHAIREALENNSVRCNPYTEANNARIVYHIFATLCPDTQADIITRYNTNIVGAKPLSTIIRKPVSPIWHCLPL